MVIPKTVIWSPAAKQDLENITDYLMHKWGNNVVTSFLRRVNWLISQIAVNPCQYPVLNPSHKVRRCVLTKQNTLFYREIKNQIEIVRIYDTRQDPEKLKILV